MIPKIIHYCWFGGNPLPKSAQRCIASWKKFCPDYEIKLWNEENFELSCNAYANEAYSRQKWAFVTDYARLCIVYENGGIYMDTDVELLKPLDPLLDSAGYMGFETGGNVATGLGFGAERHNPVIKRMLDDYENLHFILPDGGIDLTPCPVRNTESLMRLGLKNNGMRQTLDGVEVFPREYFAPLAPTAKNPELTEQTVSIHHYDASWKDAHFKIRKYIRNRFGRNRFSGFLVRAALFIYDKTHKAGQ